MNIQMTDQEIHHRLNYRYYNSHYHHDLTITMMDNLRGRLFVHNWPNKRSDEIGLTWWQWRFKKCNMIKIPINKRDYRCLNLHEYKIETRDEYNHGLAMRLWLDESVPDWYINDNDIMVDTEENAKLFYECFQKLWYDK